MRGLNNPRRFGSGGLSIAILALLPSMLSAQTKPVPNISEIHSNGQKRYTESQVIAASGLRAGQVFDLDAIQVAAQKLGQSGAFEEVQFKYRPDGGQMRVDFAVKEATKFHRCTYDNFIWTSTKEIETFVRGEVPLFDGFAPEGGELPDDVSSALEHFLKQRGITGSVERTRYAKSVGDRNWDHLYAVNGLAMKVQSVAFEGVKGIDEKLLEKEAKPLIGRSYSFVEFRKYGDASFVPIYRERGFLRISIGNPAPNSVRPTQAPNEFALQVNFPMEEGMAYDWGAAVWTGNQAESAAELDALLGMKQGQLANGKKLDAGWEAIQTAYGRKGYLEAKLDAKVVYDDAGHSVQYQVPIVEGPQYSMGEFSIGGSPEATSLKGKWKLKAGDVYDASYLQEFIKTQLRPALAVAGGRTPKIQTSIQPDRTVHTVAVSIQMQ
jgi:outer membrane protein assembly factor BamA